MDGTPTDRMKFELSTLTDYSDDALIAELQRVVKETSGKRFTRHLFDRLGRAHSTTIEKRFGSWFVALDMAGIDNSSAPRPRTLSKEALTQAIRDCLVDNPEATITRETVARFVGMNECTLSRNFGGWRAIARELGLKSSPHARRYSDEECYENVLALWTHYGRQPHFSELNQPPSNVGSKAYTMRWKGWRNALAAFIEYVVREDPETGARKVTPADDANQNSSPALIQRSLTLSLRYKILSRDKFRCVICGATPARDLNVELHIDHLLPWSRGGSNADDNLRTLCSACNLGKAAKIEH